MTVASDKGTFCTLPIDSGPFAGKLYENNSRRVRAAIIILARLLARIGVYPGFPKTFGLMQ